MRLLPSRKRFTEVWAPNETAAMGCADRRLCGACIAGGRDLDLFRLLWTSRAAAKRRRILDKRQERRSPTFCLDTIGAGRATSCDARGFRMTVGWSGI